MNGDEEYAPDASPPTAVQAYGIEWVKAAPRCGRGAKVRSTPWAKERLEILNDNRVRIKSRCYDDKRIFVASAAMAIVTSGVLTPLVVGGLAWGAMSIIVWVLVFELLFQKDRTLAFDPRNSRACYLADRKVIALEGPGGKWYGVRPKDSDRERILQDLRQLYGPRMFEE